MREKETKEGAKEKERSKRRRIEEEEGVSEGRK